MQKIRTFIAITLPQETQKHIQAIQERLSLRFPEGVAWPKPENIHLTVAFLGDRTPGEIKKIGEILEKLASQSTAMVFRPHYVKSWGYVIAIKMLSQKIRTFYAELVQAFQEEGIDYQEKHKFKPHITIGRLKERLPKKFKGSARFPGFKVEKIDLIKSTLAAEGAQYKILGSYFFKGMTRKS